MAIVSRSGKGPEARRAASDCSNGWEADECGTLTRPPAPQVAGIDRGRQRAPGGRGVDSADLRTWRAQGCAAVLRWISWPAARPSDCGPGDRPLELGGRGEE